MRESKITEGRIITYQVITGNYNKLRRHAWGDVIITYQVITGNYNVPSAYADCCFIITYQVITGNYNQLCSVPLF